MAREITATLSTEDFLSASGLDGSTRARNPFSKQKRRSWMPPVERMPPIVQFVQHVVQRWRSKCTARKEKTPLHLVGQLALGAKRHLALVDVGGVQFLVGGGTENVTVIVPVPVKAAVQAANVRDSAGTGCGDAGEDAGGELLP